jgi:REP element-mobilizing transposase RayT
MPFVSVYIHFVWSTKNRIPYLKTKALRDTMWKHIKKNAKEKGILLDHVNGHAEHCHCLISLQPDQNISRIMMMLKGESAYWFNKQKYISDKLEWQDEYFAVSVSQSMLNRVRAYIKNQEEHHKKKSFQSEADQLFSKHEFIRVKE